MPGLLTKINLSSDSNEPPVKSTRHSEQFSHLREDILFETCHAYSHLLTHTEYTKKVWSIAGFKVLVLGEIYNRKVDDVYYDIQSIISLYTQSNWILFEKEISAFINLADGDFVIQIYKDPKNFIIFNDYLGRLPLYYRITNNQLIIGSEIKSLFIPNEVVFVNRVALSEFLLYEYNIDHSTLYDGFLKFGGGALLATVDGSLDSIALKLDKLEFKGCDSRFNSRLISLLKEIAHERADKYRQHADVRSDISGGLDSRTVAYLLKKFTNIEYQTFQYTQDESAVAQNVLSTISDGKDVKFHRYVHNYINDNTNYADCVWLNDGLVNYQSNTICHYDLLATFEKSNKPYVRFTGLGISDFIRKYPHPLTPVLDLALNRTYKYGVHRNIDDVMELTGATVEELQIKLQRYLEKHSYKDVSYDESLRFLYLDFQKNYVILSSEDRERIFCWTVPIMYSNKLVKYVFNHFKPSSASYFSFIRLLNSLDNRLVKIPLFGRKISFTNPVFAAMYDILNYIRHLNSKYISTSFGAQKAQDNSSGVQIREKLTKYKTFSNLSLNQDPLKNLNKDQMIRLETLLIYFDSLHNNLGVTIKIK